METMDWTGSYSNACRQTCHGANCKTRSCNGMFAWTVTIDSLDGPLRGAAITCQTGSQWWSMGLTAKSPSGYSGNNDWAYFLPVDETNDNSYGFHGVRITAYGGNAGHLYPWPTGTAPSGLEWVAPYSDGNKHVLWDGVTCEVRFLNTGYVEYACGGTVFGRSTDSTFAQVPHQLPLLPRSVSFSRIMHRPVAHG